MKQALMTVAAGRMKRGRRIGKKRRKGMMMRRYQQQNPKMKMMMLSLRWSGVLLYTMLMVNAFALIIFGFMMLYDSSSPEAPPPVNTAMKPIAPKTPKPTVSPCLSAALAFNFRDMSCNYVDRILLDILVSDPKKWETKTCGCLDS